jgi:lipopolysaccharide transport system permease protein
MTFSRNILEQGQFVWEVFKRDFRGQYRESLGGYLWAIIPVLASIFAFIVAENSQLINYSDNKMSYKVYVIIGMALWQSFSDGLTLSVQVMEKNRVLISKLRFPIYVIFASKIIEACANHFFRMLIFTTILVYFSELNLSGMFGVFYFGLALLFLGHCVGVFLSPINLITQDVSRVLPFLMQFLIWVTPVFLNPLENSALGRYVQFNPLNIFFEASREAYDCLNCSLGYSYWWPIIVFPFLLVSYYFASTLLPIANERAT